MKSLSFFLRYVRAPTKRDLDECPDLDARRLGSIFLNGTWSNFLSAEVRHFCEDGRTFVLAYRNLCAGSLQS